MGEFWVVCWEMLFFEIAVIVAGALFGYPVFLIGSILVAICFAITSIHELRKQKNQSPC